MKAILLKVYYFFVEIIPKKIIDLSEILLLIFPVNRKRIVFSSFTGKSVSCNPRAIYEYLVRQYGDEFEYIWLFDFPTHPVIPEIVREHARCVQTDSYKSKFFKATSKVWVFNHRNTSFFRKRKNQFYLQTWHGDLGLKPIEKLTMSEKDLLSGYGKKCIKDSSILDVILVGSEWGYRLFQDVFFFEKGEFLKIGTPRNDILFANERTKKQISRRIRETYNIDESIKLCLYAPTFRNGFKAKDFFSYDSDYVSQLLKCLSERFHGKWMLMTKFHPATLDKISSHDYEKLDSVIDVSHHPDMADLLVACDVLITDYSSCIFDFGYTGKPAWLLFEDLEEYLHDIDHFVINIDQIAFPIVYSRYELLDAILKFDEISYKKRINSMYENFGSFENGNASRLISERIVQEIQKNKVI